MGMQSIHRAMLRTGLILIAGAHLSACNDSAPEPEAPDFSADVTMTWVEKYVTYEQSAAGELTMTDVHFLAEIIFDGERDFDAISASVTRDDESQPLAHFGGDDKRAFTNGYYYTRKTKSYDDIASLEREHPPESTYTWHVAGPAGRAVLSPVRIGGPDGKTQIPEVSTIRLLQGDQYVEDATAIDSTQALTIEWDPFDIGEALGGTEWSALVFVLVSDCHGAVVYTAGAPGTDTDFATFEDTTSDVPANQLEPGQDYTVFISQVYYVDHNTDRGIEQLTANSFAVELDVRTAGASEADDCPDPPIPAQYLWTRKTTGGQMETWPTVADY